MSTHKVSAGETLSGLAAKDRTSVRALAKANHISNPDLIRAGAGLRIPGSSDGFEPGKGRKSGGSKKSSEGGSVPTGSGDSQTLANAGYAAAMSIGGYESQKPCATGVSKAIKSSLGVSVSGNGNQIDNNLATNRFRQVNISLAEALKSPGYVLTWECTSTAAGSKFGHAGITAGDGRSSYSDFVEGDTLGGSAGRSDLKIFMPT